MKFSSKNIFLSLLRQNVSTKEILEYSQMSKHDFTYLRNFYLFGTPFVKL